MRNVLRLRAGQWLRHGLSPKRVAFALALGFVMGCIPILGAATPACIAIAWALRLKHFAIQTCKIRCFADAGAVDPSRLSFRGEFGSVRCRRDHAFDLRLPWINNRHSCATDESAM